ncbi:hypothetical protein EPK99_06375 [Neorhizobium lilium]|uniref:Tip attachment protein J domain-containing protein n=1 Tax=Neorhizobium lilium TaxID=2503024 RepID=A0A444LH13_9HYPH|nr:hypothetical protein [Neorhizobium lilium]RWX78255.1 hypothetical protein EPK99_06375 [Neorhizobium lilium]
MRPEITENRLGSRRYKMPQLVAGAFIALLQTAGLGYAAIGALGIAGVNALALGVGYAVTAAGAYFLSAAGQKKPSAPQPSDVQTNIRQEITARRRIYHRYLTGSVIVFGFRRGEKSYLLHYICEGPIHGYVSFRLDKKPITVDANGFVTEAQYQVGGRPRVQILTTLGTMADEPFAEILDAFPELDTPLTPFRQRGCAMVLQIVEQVPQEDLQDIYPNNMPGIQCVIDGWENVYDPRSGSFAYSGNAGCCLITEIMDVYGLTPGSVDDVNFDSFAAFADHCDEDIPLKAGGTENRYRCAGPVSLDGENEDRIKSIATICNADVYMDSQGRIAVRQKMRSTPSIALRAKNGDHLSLQLEGGRTLQKFFNTAKVSYVEPALNYKANEVRWRDESLYEDDGAEFSIPVGATLCPSATQAQRIGKLAVFESNPDFVGSVTSGPQALDLMQDYVFTLDLSPEDSFERVAAATDVIEYDGEAMSVTAPFMIFRNGAADWIAAVDEQDQVIVPLDLPSNVDDVVLAVTAVVDIQQNSAPVLRFGWGPTGAATLPDSYSQQLQVSPADADEWLDANVNQLQKTATFGPVADGGAYDWRIRNIASGKTFDWQNSTSPITVIVDPIAPVALGSFVLVSSGPRLGHAIFALSTPNDSHQYEVRIYRKVRGATLNPSADPQIVALKGVSSLSSYSHTDGDATRTNLVPNGDFASSASWLTFGAGWSISGGKATHSAGAAANIYQTGVSLPAGAIRYAFTLSGVTAGSAQLYSMTPLQSSGFKTANGQYLGTLTLTATGTETGIQAQSAFAGSVDDVILYQQTSACAPQGAWDYYAVPFNRSGIAGPASGPIAVTII